MDKKQFSKLITGLKAAYPRFTMLNTNEEMEFWYTMLQDIDYQVAQNATMEFISTSVFPPSIAEIRNLCADRLTEKPKSFDDAWGSVMKAMNRHGTWGAQAALAEMDEITRAVVKNLGWSNLCMSTNPEADRANFRIAYEKRIQEAEKERLLPMFVAEDKRQLQQKFILGIEAKGGEPGGESITQLRDVGSGEGLPEAI